MPEATRRSIPRKGGLLAALDIGSSKIACFVAKADANGELSITGVGHQLSRGIRGGAITDVAEAQTSIVAAVHAAEQMAGETIEHVTVNFSAGGQMRSRHMAVQLALSGQGVTDADLADIMHEGRESVRSGDAEILHCFPVSYTLDATRNIRDPRQMLGQELGADLHLLTANKGILRNLANCIARCHLNVTEYVVAPHASALGSLEPDEMELGTTVIDMGGGTTGIAVFAGGKNLYADILPVGGQHITNDIAKGLSTTLAHAERLKTLHGAAIPSVQDEQVLIEVPQLGEEEDGEEGTQMPRSMLVGVIRPRVEEIFELVRQRLEESGLERFIGRRVILTGGGSQLIGVRDLAARILGKQVRSGKPKSRYGLADAVSGPAFATVIGLLEFAHQSQMEEAFLQPRRTRLPTFGTDRMLRWVKENF